MIIVRDWTSLADLQKAPWPRTCVEVRTDCLDNRLVLLLHLPPSFLNLLLPPPLYPTQHLSSTSCSRCLPRTQCVPSLRNWRLTDVDAFTQNQTRWYASPRSLVFSSSHTKSLLPVLDVTSECAQNTARPMHLMAFLQGSLILTVALFSGMEREVCAVHLLWPRW